MPFQLTGLCQTGIAQGSVHIRARKSSIQSDNQSGQKQAVLAAEAAFRPE
jgi:hypothetical protein